VAGSTTMLDASKDTASHSAFTSSGESKGMARTY
jgi:hypothetical protein